MTDTIDFLLNGRPVSLRGRAPTSTLLDYLREEVSLVGTKEGCAEGDCGACTVSLGELQNGVVAHRAVNACILFLPMLEGKSIWTAEGIVGPKGELHPCQQAIVDSHGSQCGFCTPGFSMSLYVAYRNGPLKDLHEINDTLAGNLCRCTGYGPLIQAARDMYDLPKPAWEEARQADELHALQGYQSKGIIEFSVGAQTCVVPSTIDELIEAYGRFPDATIVAGATDVGLWVTKQFRIPETVIFTNRVADFRTIEDMGDGLKIGAGASYADAMQAISELSPDFGELVRRIGSVQVRNSGTIGGNIANGSPIGDTPPALIAMGARIALCKSGVRREIEIEDFFIDYGKQDRAAGEFVESIFVPKQTTPSQLKCYKLSKRFDQDISAVCGCFNIEVDAGAVVSARIAFGGMAATPKRARAVETSLVGKSWSKALVTQAMARFEEDYSPISDMRASSDYRITAAKNLLMKYYVETTAPETESRLVGVGAAF